MSRLVVVILAAGRGTRMRSAQPKLLHELCGRPLIEWPVRAALAARESRVVVVDSADRALASVLGDDLAVVVQEQPGGTGDAVLAAADEIDRDAATMVIAGDVPLITAELIDELADAHAASGAAATIATMTLADPSGYGRVVRDTEGAVKRVVETRRPGDASAEELAISEVNTGVLVFAGGPLLDALAEVRPDNAQGEYYLPDVLSILRARGEKVAAHRIEDSTLMLGVNDRADLARVRALAQARISDEHMRAGVTIVDPGSTVIDADVTIGADTTIEPATFLRGRTSVGERCVLGPLSTLVDARVGDEATVVHSYLVECELQAGARVGPFAYLRPGTLLRERAKVGTFVEVKNSDIGAGTKIPHLSYIGDADVGADSNLGAGTITANYDGRAKHRTTIGERVKGGVDTSLVAPVEIGDDAWTAAGSVITDDVPARALAIARARQRNVENYDKRDGEHD
ncbi:MAG TPA: bifunctional UDP-N-acetylglucosamine diphosphorylase/glucosamine-1-phosphate N-acetyltransferase GlmU [Solirubrobacteraceae bacterium]|nr:bifunctional UDP-N-acetylglucosamine diphosphorylase/glucosamine-1-phosphate N-acetyltransferase GlmU [Solirubrobacteraceae bacterium]